MLQQKDDERFISNNRTKKAVSLKNIELEVNVSIGKNKYLLQVQKCSNLHVEVERFLKNNKLSIKYEGPILAMVKQQLMKKGCSKLTQNQYIDELNRIKNQIDEKRKINLPVQKSQNQYVIQNQITQQLQDQNYRLTYQLQRSNKENEFYKINNKQSQDLQIQSKGNKQQIQDKNKCQNVYEKWKMKQKMKENQKKTSITPKKKQSKEKIVQKDTTKEESFCKKQNDRKLQPRQADYFYQRGLKFQYAKQIHAEHLFKQKYPFQINRQISITPSKKVQLHERLYKQHKAKQLSKIQKDISDKFTLKPAKQIDKYKQKVIERDNKINLALNYCIEHKMIENPYKIQTIAKSPFRKTNCY